MYGMSWILKTINKIPKRAWNCSQGVLIKSSPPHWIEALSQKYHKIQSCISYSFNFIIIINLGEKMNRTTKKLACNKLTRQFISGNKIQNGIDRQEKETENELVKLNQNKYKAFSIGPVF